ncbi:Stf0 family sulfotransferase [Roseobacter sinensis]|uniref:Stf0 family sulfotransferase n=1 Tax=Roseobacter sinensis TaxID=2931391 RepID=UPI00384C7AA3
MDRLPTPQWPDSRGPGHRNSADLSDGYSYEALVSLLAQAVAREAGIGEMLSAAQISPLNVFYEDLHLDPEQQVRRVMGFLDLPRQFEPDTGLVRQGDDIDEEWVQRFRSELQRRWENTGW